MDFLVGIDNNRVDEKKVERFKKYVLEELLPSMKKDANVDLSYISDNWHLFTDSRSVYSKMFRRDEGFCNNILSNHKSNARVLSFRSSLLREFEKNDDAKWSRYN